MFSILLDVDVPEVHFIFRISYYYYTMIGTVIVLVVGNVVSLWTQDDSPPVHRDLLSPVIRPWLRDDKLDYYSVNRALDMVTFENQVNSDGKITQKPTEPNVN